MAKFRIQKTSSTVNWTGKKILGLHTGNINVKSGNLEFNDDTVTSGEIVIDMASITITDIDDPVINQQFKNHLWDDDFFSIDKFPTSHLQVTRGVALGKNQYDLTGILSIKDIEHPVDFAAMMSLSTYQLNAITKQTLGKICSDIINEQIILEAKRHLLATSNQVNQIATLLGYEDISYFIRFFKKHTGYSPDAFRSNFK